MAVMKRGANVALTREVPGLTGVVVGMAWNTGAEQALADNLVTAAVLVGADGKARSESDFVFFNQLSSPELSVTDLQRVVGEDKDQIEIDFAGVPAAVDRIVIVLYVNEGPAQRRTLGQLKSFSVRVLNRADNAELVRSEDLSGGLQTETAMLVGEVYRHDGGWKFKVLGDGYSKGVAGVLADVGLSA